MTVRKKTPVTASGYTQFQEDLHAFYQFALGMKDAGALKVMVSRGDGIDYVVEFEGKEEKEDDKSPRHSMGFQVQEEYEED